MRSKNGHSLIAEAHVDLIILATGYTPPEFSLSANGFESSKFKNYFILGRGAQQSFRSRFLRGIREDAKLLASMIKEKLS